MRMMGWVFFLRINSAASSEDIECLNQKRVLGEGGYRGTPTSISPPHLTMVLAPSASLSSHSAPRYPWLPLFYSQVVSEAA